nr:MAG TPA: regulatory protein [Caudoviricetes sp.]
MTDIILSTQNGEPVASSRQIAENFGKEHKHVLDAVKNLVAENSAAKSMFYETTYENRGKQYPMYLMNRDGFSLLVMGFTGKAALEWKLKYIQAFNEMEKKLATPQMPKLSKELQALFLLDDRTQRREQRITAL